MRRADAKSLTRRALTGRGEPDNPDGDGPCMQDASVSSDPDELRQMVEMLVAGVQRQAVVK